MKMIQNVFFALTFLMAPLHVAAMKPAATPAVETEEIAEEGMSSWTLPSWLLKWWKPTAAAATLATAGGLYAFHQGTKDTVNGFAGATKDAAVAHPYRTGVAALLLSGLGYVGYNWLTASEGADKGGMASDDAQAEAPQWMHDLGRLIGLVGKDVRMTEEHAAELLMPLVKEVQEGASAFPFIESEKFVNLLSQKLKTLLVQIVQASEQDLMLKFVAEVLEDEALIGQLLSNEADWTKLLSNPGFLLTDGPYSDAFSSSDKKEAFMAYLRMRQEKNAILAEFIRKHKIVLA